MSVSVPPSKRWEKTRLQNLLRHKKSKRYYARIWRGGKEVWKSLKTAHFGVAEVRLAEYKKEQRAGLNVEAVTSNAKMTFGEAALVLTMRIDESTTIKSSTRRYWKETMEALKKSWPLVFSSEIRKITPAACQEWARTYSQSVGATRFNGALTTLRRVFQIAVDSGVVYSNPAHTISRMTAKAKKLELPTRAQFTAFVAELEAGGGRDSQNCADLVQGLAFTGCRIGESKHIEWRDIDFETGEITVKGDPDEGTKNGEIRRVPMISQARDLFSRMKAARSDEPSTSPVFRVHECQKAMTRAANLVGMERITHHDLRHFFATVCIESGVDIPTVSRWLGHKDGGALAMRTYGHLRREHSVSQARKVSFEP